MSCGAIKRFILSYSFVRGYRRKCVEGLYCSPGTDFSDYCEAVGQVKVWAASFDDGTPNPDAGRSLTPAPVRRAVLAYCKTGTDLGVAGGHRIELRGSEAQAGRRR